MSVLSSWRTAVRIAWREARRARGRSILVTALLALPVVALGFAAATVDMLTLTGAERATQRMGAADARVSWPLHQPVMQLPDPQEQYASVALGPTTDEEALRPGTEEELVAVLPGSRLLPVRRGTTVVRTPNGLGQPDAVMVDATDPLAAGFVEVLDGRAPETAAEVALTKQAMAWLDAGIGDRITVLAGEMPRVSTVVGEVEFPSLLDSVLLFGYEPDDEAVGAWLRVGENSWLVDAPEPIGWDRVLELNEQGIVVASREVFEHPPPDEAVPMLTQWPRFGDNRVAVSVLVGGLALLEVVLLAGPAFAISARRRQRQLALVAANGGTPAHVRRVVLADGVVIGVLGALVGVALGAAGALLARPWIEENLAHARAGGYRVYPEALVAVAALAVLAGVLAALVPAFVTARQDVVAALAGRRGATRSRKRWIAVGLVMIGVGGAITYAAAMVYNTPVILGGLIVGELGLVLCTPALVGLVARLGRLLPLAPRVALRDAARNRAAAAPAISAVMAAVAGSVALGMYLDSQEAHARALHSQAFPTGTVTATFAYSDLEQPPALDAIERALRRTLPVGDLYRVGSIECRPGSPSQPLCSVQVLIGDACPQLAKLVAGEVLTRADRVAAAADPDCDPLGRLDAGVLVDDGTAVAALTGATGEDLRRAQAALAAGGVVVRSPALISDGEVRLSVIRADPQADPEELADRDDPLRTGQRDAPPGYTITEVTVPGHLLTTGVGPGPAIIPPAVVADLGLNTVPSMIVGPTTRLPQAAEQERAAAALGPLGSGLHIEYGFRREVDEELLVLLAASALVTIGAAAVGTALAAADSRQDLSTLASVGASPRLRRGLSVSQAWVIAGLGSLIGAPAGMAATTAILTANAQQWGDTLWPDTAPPAPVMPWSTLLITLVVVPAVAILGAGLLTRSRLPIERRR